MEEELKKAADRNADGLNDKVGQQARNAPVDPTVDKGSKRRTWEGYADDYRALSERLVNASHAQQQTLTQVEGLKAELEAKDAHLRRVQAQRLKDLDRLAAVSRTRDMLEKRAAAQMAKVAAALARAAAPPMAVEVNAADIVVTPDPEPVLPLIEAIEALEVPDIDMPQIPESLTPDVPECLTPDVLEPAMPEASESIVTLAPDSEQQQALAANSFFTRFEQHDGRPLGWSDRGMWRQTIKAAQSAHKQGRLELSQKLFEAALLIKPTASLWEQLGHVLRETGQFLDGELAYRRALGLRPDAAELMFLSGYCLEMAGQFGEAASLYDAALSADPTLASRYTHLRDYRSRFGY